MALIRPDNPPTASEPARAASSRRGRIAPGKLILVALLLLGTVAIVVQQVVQRMTHVSEYDARVTADMVTVSSRAEGWVVDLPAREGLRVEAGQVIVRIDDRISRLRVDALQSQIDSVQADRERLLAERHMAENQANARSKTLLSGVRATEAARSALDADIQLARQELDRARSLSRRGMISEKQLETAQADVTRLQSTRRKLDAERLQAEGSLAEAQVGLDRLQVIDRQIAALDPVEANLQAQLRQHEIDVGDRTIKSPVSAVIDRVFVELGEYVQGGRRILMLHDPEQVWVEANIKETQLRKLKVGQPVRIAVDAWPDDRFFGTVARIGSATTSRFALLPSPNPSGNFTKITQRVPVKVDFTEMPRPLSPGMMVEVDIDIR